MALIKGLDLPEGFHASKLVMPEDHPLTTIKVGFSRFLYFDMDREQAYQAATVKNLVLPHIPFLVADIEDLIKKYKENN